jgi:hypothetical protein
MNALGAWTWVQPAKLSLRQRLNSSQYHRLRGGVLEAPPARSTVAPIRHQTCQWIEGDPLAEGGTVFCAEKVEAGKPYCPSHCCRAYVRLPKDHADE